MMKNENIAVIGTIGVGKTTLIRAMEAKLKLNNTVLVKPEPSVTIPFVNEALKRFYTDNDAWAYPMQLLITSSQEAYMQDLESADYDYSIIDMPYSSEIYGYSHFKNGRLNHDEFLKLLSAGRTFRFDYLIILKSDKETTINRILGRNKKIDNNETVNVGGKDVQIEDFSYLDGHITDFMEYLPIHITRFKRMNPDIKIIELDTLPDMNTDKDSYEDIINNLCKEIEDNNDERKRCTTRVV